MDNPIPQAIMPPKDSVSYSDAQKWVQNWKDFISNAYKDSKVPAPLGIYIPLEDLQAMIEYHQQFDVHMTGVRAYFALKDSPAPGVLASGITAVLVPATFSGVTDSDGEPVFDDVIEKIAPIEPAAADQHYTIYDVLRPCPTCCGELHDFLNIK